MGSGSIPTLMLNYGGGLKLELGDNLSLTGDWTVYEFDILETDVISLGFNYRF